MRFTGVKPLRSYRDSSELPPERPLTSREAAEAVLVFIPSSDRANPSGLTLAGPSKVRLGLTTFYPWWLTATHQLRHALDRRAHRSIC